MIIGMKKKFLVGKPLPFHSGFEQELLKQIEIVISPQPTEEAMLALAGDIHGIIAHGSGVSSRLIKAAPLLEIIAAPQVGYDSIDVDAATEAGIPVVTNAGLAPGTVAEFTIGLMIALARRIVKADSDLRRLKNWSSRAPYTVSAQELGTDLCGATVGLVGFGSIGITLTRMLQAAFATPVLAFDPFVSGEKMAAFQVEKRENLLSLAQDVDFLSLHVALNRTTRHLIDEKCLRSMKPSAFLINCARGEIVDEQALVKALQGNWIAGAAIDVFEQEPITSENPLLSLPNVVITPHIAGISVQSSRERGKMLAGRLLKALSGERPEGLVNPVVWEKYLDKIKTRP
jgi:D-3-phosphoglycerate dehydrogenase / 2-oxoglutarate reductase